jgi:hypothetical protein
LEATALNDMLSSFTVPPGPGSVMAEVQVPPGEPQGRRRSADADVDVDPLFGIQF